MCIKEEAFINNDKIQKNYEYCSIGNGVIVGQKIILNCAHICCKECFDKISDKKCPSCSIKIDESVSANSSFGNNLDVK